MRMGLGDGAATPGANAAVAGPAAQSTIDLTPAILAGEKPGDRIGRYKLLQEIGVGGMGSVWMAEQEQPVRRRVALKVIKLGMDTKQVIGRFEAERQALALMDHPNIAKVLDAGATETGRPYFAMELVKGIPITQYCDDNKLDPEARLRLFIEVCRAIQHAHQKGIIHRDIKPSNILIANHDGKPVPKVIDFGIAKATDQKLTDKTVFTAFEQFIGTPAYMSPEQAEMNALDIDTRTDIYSLGVLLYELLTGKTPFDAKELISAGLEGMRKLIREKEPARPSTRISTLENVEQATVAHQRHSEPPKLVHRVQGDLDWIAMKCLEKDRTRRYETANGLAADIERHLGNEPVVARPPSNLYRFQKFVRRNKFACATTALVVLTLAGGVCALTFLLRHAEESRKREAQLRLEAVSARKGEMEQRLQAQVEASRARNEASRANKALAASLVAEGDRLAQENQAGKGLAYFAQACRLDPQSSVAGYRIVSVLSQRDFPLPLTQPPKHIAFDPLSVPAFSGDWTRFCLWTNETSLLICRSPGGAAVGEPLRFDSAPTSVVLDEHGARLAAVFSDKTQILECDTGHLLNEFNGRLDAFSPTGTKLLIGNSIFDVNSGQKLCSLEAQDQRESAAVFSPDGEKIAFVTYANRGSTFVLSTSTGKPLIDTIPTPVVGHRIVSFALDSRHLFIGGGGRGIEVWDLVSKRQKFRNLRPNEGEALFWSFTSSPDARMVIGGCRNGLTYSWSLNTGVPAREPCIGVSSVGKVMCSPGGDYLETYHLPTFGGVPAKTRHWDVRRGCETPVRRYHPGGIIEGGFSQDCTLVWTRSSDNCVRVWKAEDSSVLLTTPQPKNRNLTSCCLSPNAALLAAGYDNGVASIWEVSSGRLVHEVQHHQQRISCLAFSADSKRLLSGSGDSDLVFGKRDSIVCLYDLQTSQVLAAITNNAGSVRQLCLSPDGQRLVIAYHDHPELWDLRLRHRIGKPMTARLGWINHVEFSHDGKWVSVTSQNEAAQLWDGTTAEGPIMSFPHGSGNLGARFSHDDRLLVVASQDQTARIWDRASGRPVTEPLVHGGAVLDASFSPDDTKAITASADGTALVWDVGTGRRLSEPFSHPGRAEVARFSTDGRRILIGGGGWGSIYDWIDLETPTPLWLPELAEAVGGYALSESAVALYLDDAASRVERVRGKLLASIDAGALIGWARWYLADRLTRPISPNSALGVSNYAQRLASQDEYEALNESLDLLPQNAAVYEKLSALLELSQPDRSQWYRQLALGQKRGAERNRRKPDEGPLSIAPAVEHATNTTCLDASNVPRLLEFTGQVVRVKGKVEQLRASVLGFYLNFSEDYPSALSLVFIRDTNRNEFRPDLLSQYTNRTVIVEGRISESKGRAEMYMRSLSQITLDESAPSLAAKPPPSPAGDVVFDPTDITELLKRKGQRIKTRGTIAGFFQSRSGGVLILNYADTYSSALSLVFYQQDNPDEFRPELLKTYLHKLVFAEGEVSIYKEKSPQIVIRSLSQLRIEEASPPQERAAAPAKE
jgi:eukaryotic-like serine/threonine-protein kinase